MNDITYTQAVARTLAGRLHRSGTAYRCRCGQCRHLILTSARRSGIAPERLLSALPPERPARREERRARRRSMTAPIASTMTVLQGGRQLSGPAAVLRIVGAE
ncbi:hypothetical protein D0Z08_19455 [Nocardioides immobilis]|uniref:Uncharacterized protein n=1 Tax=Nocardioides immobilis TaxID=2049295 RepID=A0A417XYG0_9ACTN|nr:hypothetical protein [Nocardioides immobilis]RHW25406.1 hypothetical protein D0Z08_19455 [Nocardioides immobilis]